MRTTRTTTTRRLTMAVCVLGSAVSCGGSSGRTTAGAGGSAAGHPGGGASGSGAVAAGGASGFAGSAGNGGASGSAGLAGTGGSVDRDAGATDARAADAAADGTTPPCAVAVDGGTVACTIQIASGNDNDLYCGLKADGRINCWAAHNDAFLFQQGEAWPPAIAGAPPHLTQLAMTNDLAGSGPPGFNLCGIDQSGTGLCWIGGPSKDMGAGLAAIVLSNYGVCTLGTNGAVTCASGFASLPPTTVGYTKILASENTIAALDVTGVPHYRQFSFPAGVYTDITTNDNARVGAVRSDGTAVTIVGGDNMVTKAGSFRHIALDYLGRACALDASGEVTCWPIETAVGLPADLTPPAGPFVQIIGAESTFCALRATGTTACWGDSQIDLPAGW